MHILVFFIFSFRNQKLKENDSNVVRRNIRKSLLFNLHLNHLIA